MIDTVRFRIPEAMPLELLADWGSLRKPKHGIVWNKYFNSFEGPFGNRVQTIYYPQDRDMNPVPLILVETSLPKFVSGNNVGMLINVSEAIKSLALFISEPLGRKVDLFTAELDRIDLCYNHHVGNYVDDFIKYLLGVAHPTKETKPYYPTNGVHFYRPSASLSFYDKYLESHLKIAEGILREELSLGTKWNVRRTLKKASPSQPVFITDFTAVVVERILKRENGKLGLNDVVIADDTIALKVLTGKYGTKRGMSLYGYMCAFADATTKEMLKLGVSKQTISRNKALINKANIASQLADQNVKLPTLTINLKDTIE